MPFVQRVVAVSLITLHVVLAAAITQNTPVATQVAGTGRRLVDGAVAGDAFAQHMIEEQQRWKRTNQQAREQQQQQQQHQQQRPDDVEQGASLSHTPQRALPDGQPNPQAGIPIAFVAFMTIAMASAAGLGALPFFFVKSLSPRWSALSTAVACGVMFAASFDLIHEGQPYGPSLVVLGMFLGGMCIRAMQRWLDRIEDVKFGHLSGRNARRMLMIVGIMAAHAVGEGCGVGVSFCGEHGWAQGVLTTIAIGVHNVPEGLAKATVLVGQGAAPTEALLWSIVTCLPQPLVALPSFLFVDTFRALLPVALGFAAGCMVWMVFAELLPDALKGTSSSEVASAATLAAAALEGIRMGFESLDAFTGMTSSTLPSPTAGMGGLEALTLSLSPPHGGIALDHTNGSIYSTLVPATLAAVPAVLLAGLSGGIISGSGFPTAIVLGFSAGVTIISGMSPIFQQLWSMIRIPVAHTLSAAAVGGVGAVLLRRQMLRFVLSRGAGGSKGGVPAAGAGAGAAHAANGGGGGSKEDVEGAYGGFGKSTQQFGALFSQHHSDYSSKAKTSGDLSKIMANGASDGAGRRAYNRGAETSHAFDKELKKLAGPARAAGIVAMAALTAQCVPLGWQLTRVIFSVSGDLTAGSAPMAAGLLLRGAAAGGAARTAFGRSAFTGAFFAACIGVLTAVSMASSYSGAKGEAADVVAAALSYPRGWTDTLSAVGGGGVAMAGAMQFALGMSVKGRHARFGGLAAAVLVGGAAALLWFGCHAFSLEPACAAFHYT